MCVSSSLYGSWLTGGSLGITFEPRLTLLLYAMLAYSWRSGKTDRRNWQKSFLMPNHPENIVENIDKLIRTLILITGYNSIFKEKSPDFIYLLMQFAIRGMRTKCLKTNLHYLFKCTFIFMCWICGCASFIFRYIIQISFLCSSYFLFENAQQRIFIEVFSAYFQRLI